MCRRSESDWVHSQSRAQASSREISCVMAVTLAERTGPSDATDGRASVVPETSGPSAMGTLERAPANQCAPTDTDGKVCNRRRRVAVRHDHTRRKQKWCAADNGGLPVD